MKILKFNSLEELKEQLLSWLKSGEIGFYTGIFKHKEVFNYLKQFYDDTLSDKEILYLFLNNLKEPIKCKNCGNKSKFINSKVGYSKYCCNKCYFENAKSNHEVVYKNKPKNKIVKDTEIKEIIWQRPLFNKIITNDDKIIYECKKCGHQDITTRGISNHTKYCFTKEETERLYKEFHDDKINFIELKDEDGNIKYKCKGCGEIFDKKWSCHSHTIWCEKIYNMTKEEMSNKKKNRLEKSRNTREILYGDPNYHNVEQMKETNLRLYNDTNVLGKNSPIYEKRNQTVRDKYNCDNVFQTQEVKDKMKITMLNNYGVEFAGQTKNSRENCPFRKYLYKNIFFDSAAEFAFYLENENNGIKRNMDISFSYTYKNDNHLTWPDFIMNNQFYEIKGSHFLDKETGKWILPRYRKKKLSEEDYVTACELMECRHQCLLQNNVKIIYDYEIKDLIKKYKDTMINYKYDKNKKDEEKVM